jgi:hypothetical protein
MKYKIYVKVITAMVQIILAFVMLLLFTAFAIRPTEFLLLTNALILMMVMVQLYSVSILTDIYEKMEVRKR